MKLDFTLANTCSILPIIGHRIDNFQCETWRLGDNFFAGYSLVWAVCLNLKDVQA
jgi:hypothetical protein